MTGYRDCFSLLLYISSILLHGSKEAEEEEAEGGTHRLHHVKLLPVLHLLDLVHVLHGRFIEVDSLFVQDLISLWGIYRKTRKVQIAACFCHSYVTMITTCCTSPPEVESPSSWQRDSGVCPPGSNISHCLSQTSSSFPARQVGKIALGLNQDGVCLAERQVTENSFYAM